HRGIGRYSMALAKAMLRARGPHDIVIALNGMFAETIAPIREAFDGLVAPQDIRVWHASAPPRALAAGPAGYVEAARRIRQAFLESLQPDFVHLASLFETSSYAVTAVPERPAPFRTAVTLYDLIPHINPEVYLATPQAAA